MEIAAGLAVLKGITSGLDAVNKLLSVISDSSSREQLIQLKENLLNAKEEALALREEVATLRGTLATKEKLKFNRRLDAYYKDLGDGKQDGLYCKTCWDKDSKLIRLDTRGYCSVCKEGYGETWRSGSDTVGSDWTDDGY